MKTNQNALNEVASTVLGKQFNDYKTSYDPSLIVPIQRGLNREDEGIQDDLFEGADAWHAYEVSFLTEKGLPSTCVGKIVIPADSEFFVESKSLKLYLYSLNMERYGQTQQEGIQIVTDIITKDLNEALKTNVDVTLHLKESSKPAFQATPIGDLIDLDSIEFEEFSKDANIIKVQDTPGSNFIRVDGVRSNCRVTHQPDFSTLFVRYNANKTLDLESLMRFAVSFRNENHFHEEVAEYIFKQLNDALNPESLMIAMLYTRRGGIDICPVRYTPGTKDEDVREFLDSTVLTNKTINQ